MLTVDTVKELAQHVGQKLGTSEWLEIDQPMIDAFAKSTGDDYWIHIDPDRAKKELPGGKTIAHGFLTLSLIPLMSRTVYHVRKRGTGFNYGINRVRFTAPVQVGARLRLTQTLKEAEVTERGTRFTFESVMEREGHERPVMVAETMVLLADG
jgi:acyl dehydratase